MANTHAPASKRLRAGADRNASEATSPESVLRSRRADDVRQCNNQPELDRALQLERGFQKAGSHAPELVKYSRASVRSVELVTRPCMPLMHAALARMTTPRTNQLWPKPGVLQLASLAEAELANVNRAKAEQAEAKMAKIKRL